MGPKIKTQYNHTALEEDEEDRLFIVINEVLIKFSPVVFNVPVFSVENQVVQLKVENCEWGQKERLKFAQSLTWTSNSSGSPW